MQVIDGGLSLTPSRPMLCRVLALLLMRPNHIVSTDAIIRELWDDDPPPSAMQTIQTYIHHIRKILGDGDSFRAAREILLTRKPGYLLKVDPVDIDSSRFTELLPQGRHKLEKGDYAGAVSSLRAALSLWDGPALADISAGPLLTAHIVDLEESRLAALELRIEADLKLGRHRHILGELRSLVEMYPLNERLRGQLVIALNRSGRRCEALGEYHRARRMLNEEFGLEPDRELRSIQQDILTEQVS